MAKLQDMFTQARRAQSSGGIGFLGKTKAEMKARAAALVVDITRVTEGCAEATLKAGADGLLFNWDGKDSKVLATINEEIASAKASSEQLISGVRITGNGNELERESVANLKEQGIQYVVLPFDAPARLLALHSKDFELVVTVPMRKDDLYPIFVRNLVALDGISAVLLDFDLPKDIGAMSIEDILHYRAVREAVRFPALLPVSHSLNEEEAQTLMRLGIQAFVLPSSGKEETTREQIKALRDVLVQVYQDDKDKDNSTVSISGRY